VRVGLDGKWVGANSGEPILDLRWTPATITSAWTGNRTWYLEGRQKLGAAAVLKAEEGRAYYFVATAILAGPEDLTLVQVDDAEGLWLLSKSMKCDWKDKK
jgi:hypothetical protein